MFQDEKKPEGDKNEKILLYMFSMYYTEVVVDTIEKELFGQAYVLFPKRVYMYESIDRFVAPGNVHVRRTMWTVKIVIREKPKVRNLVQPVSAVDKLACEKMLTRFLLTASDDEYIFAFWKREVCLPSCLEPLVECIETIYFFVRFLRPVQALHKVNKNRRWVRLRRIDTYKSDISASTKKSKK